MRSPVLLAFCFLCLASCGKVPIPAPTSPPEAVLPAAYQRVSPDEAEKLIATTPALGILDMRDDAERQSGAGMIQGARACSYFAGNEAILRGLDRKQPWLVYCAIGGRSEYGAQDMAKLGFQKVYLLKGGFNAWVAAHKPVVK